MPHSRIAIIGAPLDLGQDRRGVDMGPSAVRVANLHRRITELGYEVADWGNIPVEQKESWPEGEASAKYLAQIAAACDALAGRVEEALAGGGLALVLGGGHSGGGRVRRGGGRGGRGARGRAHAAGARRRSFGRGRDRKRRRPLFSRARK